MSHRRMFMSHSNTLFAEPSLHLAANRRESLGAAGFVARDDDGLGVRRANQSPSITKKDANAVDVDDVVTTAEVLHRAFDEIELDLLRHLDAKLRRRDEVGNVRQHL